MVDDEAIAVKIARHALEKAGLQVRRSRGRRQGLSHDGSRRAEAAVAGPEAETSENEIGVQEMESVHLFTYHTCSCTRAWGRNRCEGAD